MDILLRFDLKLTIHSPCCKFGYYFHLGRLRSRPFPLGRLGSRPPLGRLGSRLSSWETWKSPASVGDLEVARFLLGDLEVACFLLGELEVARFSGFNFFRSSFLSFLDVESDKVNKCFKHNNWLQYLYYFLKSCQFLFSKRNLGDSLQFGVNESTEASWTSRPELNKTSGTQQRFIWFCSVLRSYCM